MIRLAPALSGAAGPKKKGFDVVKIVHWITLALFSAAAVLLRIRLLALGFDETGLPVAMDFETLALPALLVLAAVVTVLLSRRLPARRELCAGMELYFPFDRSVFAVMLMVLGSFALVASAVCELVFNTSPVGYQEIVSDPSYTFQAVVMTYPLIGNYGVCDEDYETRVPSIGGLVVRDYNGRPSNFRYTKTLDEIMSEYGIVGISGVDTRCLARKLRNEGSQKGIITSSDVSTQEALKRLERPLPRNAVSCVSTRKKWFSRTAHA